MSGYVCLHRRLMDNPVWTQMKPEYLKLFMTILMRANYAQTKALVDGEQITIEPGTMLTSYPDLARQSGLTVSQIRTGLASLLRLGIITKKLAGGCTLLTLLNWGTYQGASQAVDRELAGDSQAIDRRLAVSKKERREEGDKTTPLFGGDEAETPLASDSDKTSIHPVSKKTVWSKAESRKSFEEKFWPVVWHKVGKSEALEEYIRRVVDGAMADRVREAAILQGPLIVANAMARGSTPIHPRTWLHNGRFDDDLDALRVFEGAPSTNPKQLAWENA